MLRECYRILTDGGSLIITVPDLKALARRWLLGQISDYTMFACCCGAFMGEESDRHRWHYTVESLTDSLNKLSPWSRVGLFDWREIAGAAIAKDFWILGVEAIK
jgi:predicted SAM-dependent methyltransferase